jgi:Uma2 family endonuclease
MVKRDGSDGEVRAMTTKTRLTADDLWRMGEGEVRRELVDGEVVEMTPAGGVQGDVTGKVYRRLADHVDARGLGKVVVGDVGFVLSLPSDPERVRAPDVAFVSTRSLPEGRLPQGFIPGAPDLAVEVLSPSENPVEIQQKVRDYLEGGSRLLWVVAPRARTATVYRPDGSARLIREPEPLEGEDVLPGLTIALTDLLD